MVAHCRLLPSCSHIFNPGVLLNRLSLLCQLVQAFPRYAHSRCLLLIPWPRTCRDRGIFLRVPPVELPCGNVDFADARSSQCVLMLVCNLRLHSVSGHMGRLQFHNGRSFVSVSSSPSRSCTTNGGTRMCPESMTLSLSFVCRSNSPLVTAGGLVTLATLDNVAVLQVLVCSGSPQIPAGMWQNWSHFEATRSSTSRFSSA